MKRTYLAQLLCAIICILGFSVAQAAGKNSVWQQTESDVKAATYGHIDAKALKVLMEVKATFILLDGRGKTKWDDGRRIPGAKATNFESSTTEFEALIPSKDNLVIVYCGAYECPLGKKLAEKLVNVGYKNVLEYPGGIKEWSGVANYPTEMDESVKH